MPKAVRIKNSLIVFGAFGGLAGYFGYRWYEWPFELVPIDDWGVWIEQGIFVGVGILIGCVAGLVIGFFKISESFVDSGDGDGDGDSSGDGK